MTDHATALEGQLLNQANNKPEPVKRWMPPAERPTPTPAMAPKMRQICELLVELPHEDVKYMSRGVLSDLVTVTDKSVADMIESLIGFARRELGKTSA